VYLLFLLHTMTFTIRMLPVEQNSDYFASYQDIIQREKQWTVKVPALSDNEGNKV